jgi:aldose sugar dehydrogenase
MSRVRPGNDPTVPGNTVNARATVRGGGATTMTAPAGRALAVLLALAVATALLGVGVLGVGVLAAPAGAQAPVDAPGLPGVGLQQQVLTTDVTDPTRLEIADDGRVLIAERTGRIKIWEQDGTLSTAGRIPVGANSCDGCTDDLPEEGGLHGLLLSPDFLETGHLYVYYSAPNTLGQDPVSPRHPEAAGTFEAEGLFRLSRITLDDGVLDLDTEQILLENPTYWSLCCHYGGDLEWLPDGTIVLSTGDDTNPHESSGFAPTDDGPGREAFNAVRTSQNPADRRGKLLRLNPDGTVPDGSQEGVAANPFVDDPAYDPYVYALGFRSPYSIEVHEPSGAVLVGNVGPDAYFADPARGPAGLDEVEVVPAGGGTNHGWPFCIGDNEPYVEYDFILGSSGEPFSCDGMTPAAVSYPYLVDLEAPQLLAGPRASMVGVVYPDDAAGALALPQAMFGNQLLFSEWMRNTLYTMPVDVEGALDGSAPVPVHLGTMRTIDQTVGPDGAVYIAEYGAGFYDNPNSQISRLTCLGCQPDSADYAGEPMVRSVDLPTAALGVEGGTRNLTTGGVALAGVLLLGAGIPLRRRVS